VEKYQTAAKLKQLPPTYEAQLQLKTSSQASTTDKTTPHTPATYSGSDALESALATEAKDQLIEKLQARIAALEASDKQQSVAAKNPPADRGTYP